uniref:Uncharacterized protein n=1 Tax=Anguilla anguilla TaxID=7936 RepID=A0A0E9QA25_ANGAN
MNSHVCCVSKVL